MTPEEVRQELPNVEVRMPNGEIMVGKVTGRKCLVATVTISYIGSGVKKLRDFRADGVPWMDAKFSWEAIARAITEGKPLEWSA